MAVLIAALPFKYPAAPYEAAMLIEASLARRVHAEGRHVTASAPSVALGKSRVTMGLILAGSLPNFRMPALA